MFKMHKISLRERKHAQTKIALVQAIMEELKEKRLKDISVKEVCETIPISEVTFYNYFPKKTDVLLYIIQLWGIEITWYLQQWEAEKSNLEIIEAFFDHVVHQIEMNPQVLNEALGFFAQKREEPSLEDLSVAEKLLAFPDLPGIEQIQIPGSPSKRQQLLAPYIRRAVECGELPQETDIETFSNILSSILIGVMMHLHRTDLTQIRSTYRTLLRLLWKGLWAEATEGLSMEQPEFEYAGN